MQRRQHHIQCRPNQRHKPEEKRWNWKLIPTKIEVSLSGNHCILTLTAPRYTGTFLKSCPSIAKYLWNPWNYRWFQYWRYTFLLLFRIVAPESASGKYFDRRKLLISDPCFQSSWFIYLHSRQTGVPYFNMSICWFHFYTEMAGVIVICFSGFNHNFV